MKYSLQKQTLYNDIYRYIQQKTHFNSKEMNKYFPDVCELAYNEQFTNMEQYMDKWCRQGAYLRKKERKEG